MPREAKLLLLVAGGLGLVGLLLSLLVLTNSPALARIPRSAVLIFLGIALLVGGRPLARVNAIAYRHSPRTQRLAQLFFMALGLVSLLLGIAALIQEQ